MTNPRYPLLYQINTRVWLTEISRKIGRRATLDDIPDAELDRLAAKGFDWIWFLSVWQTGLAGQRISRSNAEWLREFKETLPDLRDEDIPGSGFAITGYTTHPNLGGDAALARLRDRMRRRGLRLLLDFVPNHTGPDHPWVEDHPEYYVPGTAQDLARSPGNYTRVPRKKGDLILAFGRDPYFPGWPDALQLNYGNPATQEAMIGELSRIAGQCDGVRCDMAMLVLPEVFERTWGIRSQPFWPKATQRVREMHPGFDYAYDKRLYDRLREGHARPVREHFHAGLDYQDKLARFLENHDEPRAAAVFARDVQVAAAAITFLSPGLRFLHDGQFEGRKKRISPHLARRPDEPVDADLVRFYDRLLAILQKPVVRNGHWRLLECDSAWEGNWTRDCFLAFLWELSGEDRLLVVVNYAGNQSQCCVKLPLGDIANRIWRLEDLLSTDVYIRDGNDLHVRGLFVDMRPWQAAVFTLKKAEK